MADQDQKVPQEGQRDDLHQVGEVIEIIEEGDIVEVVEIEIYGRDNKKPPRARKYHIRIDKEPKVVEKRFIDGRELLHLVNKTPEEWRLFQKLHGGHMEEIEPEQSVDLGKQGIERFTTMEKAQRPGEQTATVAQMTVAPAEPEPRRVFRLPADDETYLDTLGLRWETVIDGGIRWVLIHEHPIPDGYDHEMVIVAIRIEGGYPPAALDMAYVYPPLLRKDGRAIPKLSTQALDGQMYQRWSRHYDWREGIDNLPLHHLRVKNWMASELKN
jgi:hypothetical protein